MTCRPRLLSVPILKPLKSMKHSPRLLAAILMPCACLVSPTNLTAETIGFWRFDEAEVADGDIIELAVSESNSPALDAPGESDTTYSNDVPGSLTQDPVTGASWSNRFSQNASSGNGKIRVPNDPGLNPEDGFTMEFFIKLTGEPGGWHSFIRRNEAGNLRWQVDFNHSTQPANFGRIRSRWDTPDGDTNNVAFGGQIFVDTDTGSGNPDDYDDPEDLANNGDSENDVPNWHHVALTFDPEVKEFAMFTDYEEVGRKTLAGSFAHPDAVITIGKHNAGDYGLFMDEVRFSSGVLEPDQFLQATDDVSDDDEDGLPDAWEQLFFGDLAQTPDGDPDGDGLTNAEENANTTKPNEPDSDGDGLEDGDEVARGTDPNAIDSDGDLLADGDEVNEHQTDPANPDTDGDEFPDGVEIAAATDPTAADSKPADGNVYLVANDRPWDGQVWSDGGTPAQGNQYFVVAGLSNKVTNPSTEGAVFAGDRLTISGEGAQLGLDRPAEIASLTLKEGGALVSDGNTFAPTLIGSVTVEGSAHLVLPTEGRNLTINAPINGAGDVHVGGLDENALAGGTATLAGDSNDFIGNWTVGPTTTLKVLNAGALDAGDITLNNGALDADYNINNPGGRLILNGGETQIALDQDHIFGGLFIGETDLLAVAQDAGLAEDGVFTYELLIGLGFPEETLVDGGGTITVSIDSDNDGLADSWETANFGNLDQAADDDPDNDTLNNAQEILAGTNPNETDTDGDTLSDGQEFNEIGSDPTLADTDADGVADNDEVTNGTSPVLADSDGDALNDGDEIVAATDPTNPDTDGDRFPDGVEVSNDSDPLSRNSTPPLFQVRVIKSTGPVNNLEAVENLAAGNDVAEEVIFYDQSVNFTDNPGNQRVFEGDRAFPFTPIQNLAIVATGPFVIDSAGTYSVGVNSDDGFRVTIDGETVSEFLVGRGTRHTVNTVELSEGQHQLEFLYWQGGGGASVELYISSEPADVVIEDDASLPNPEIFQLLAAGQVPGGGGPVIGDGDTDGDGQSDEDEVLAGTDPNDPTSFLRLIDVQRMANSVSVRWASVAGKSYDIEYSATLEPGSWIVIGSADNVAESTTSFDDSDATRVANPDGFYRSKVK